MIFIYLPLFFVGLWFLIEDVMGKHSFYETALDFMLTFFWFIAVCKELSGA